MEQFVGPALTLIVVVVGAAVAWGKLGSRLDSIDDCTRRMAQTCVVNRGDCQLKMNTDLVKLAVVVDDLKKLKDHRWEELDRSLRNIENFMGRTEQYMRMHNSGGGNSSMGGKMS
jgi:hypothetical protein